ncbi:DUF3618 domain-containing protein [Lysobacter sp. D1-1-M9]|uniref:DUF3618 domain-containing protein n=1 Tax=Novilysobacter longmucuonensis TaxID=3098603 RepID=UPI002FC5A88E
MNTRDSIRTQSQKDPAQLERELDRQRDHIGELIEALEHKMSPGQMFERALSYGKGGGREFASNLSDTVRANPVPTLLTAAGLAWLYAGQGKRPADRYGTTETTGHVTGSQHKSHVGERVGEMRAGMSEKVGSARHRIGESAHGAMDSARHQAQRASAGYRDMLDNNPMALGAIGIAVGALMGAMLPSTRKEDQLMGEASDHLTEEARHKARSGMDQAVQAGREATDPAAHDGGQHRGSQSETQPPGLGNSPTSGLSQL